MGQVSALIIMSPVITSALVVFLLAGSDSELLECQAIQTDTARLACYDKAMGRGTSEMTAVPEPAATQDTAVEDSGIGQETISDIDPEELFGISANETEKLVEEAIGIESIDAIEARVTKVHRNPAGKMVIALENQQRWIQLDSKRLNLHPGEKVRVRRGAMNSFLMAKSVGGLSIRVKRID